jgi:predicted RNA-binding Zn-ribbon protein involved in translation (DUF1610 family)
VSAVEIPAGTFNREAMTQDRRCRSCAWEGKTGETSCPECGDILLVITYSIRTGERITPTQLEERINGLRKIAGAEAKPMNGVLHIPLVQAVCRLDHEVLKADALAKGIALFCPDCFEPLVLDDDIPF